MDIAFRDAEGMPIPLDQEAQQPTQLLTKDTIGSTTNWSAPDRRPGSVPEALASDQ